MKKQCPTTQKDSPALVTDAVMAQSLYLVTTTHADDPERPRVDLAQGMAVLAAL